jgi:glycosyltransferase involved in cell wall biosynthesis
MGLQRPMKIALVVPSWPPGGTANGIVTYASLLVPALRRLGHEVFVLTFHRSADDRDPYTIDLGNFIPVPNFWDRAMYRIAPEIASFNSITLAIRSAIIETIQKYQLDVLEIEESFGWSYVISRLKLLPVVVRLHGPWIVNGKFSDFGNRMVQTRRRQRLEGRGIAHAEYVTAPSAAVLQVVKDHYRLDLTASRVIPNPIDAAVEAETWSSSTCGRDSLLFIGRFDALKGGDLVLRAFSELAASSMNLKLTFVGHDVGIKRLDGKTRTFEEFVRDNLSRSTALQIKYYEYLSHANVMSLRPEHCVTMIASRHEMMPYSVLEAMSLGCPIVATAVGGIPELIKDQHNGLLVPSQNAAAIAASIQRLLNDPALAARLGRQAWRDCRDLYGSDSIARQTVAVYQEASDAFKFRTTGGDWSAVSLFSIL